jgi:tetratricopeptide (TPR) repeat protein
LLLALFPWGLWSVSRKRKMDVAAPFLLVMALYAAGVLLFFVNGRYRIPLWPPMALFAGGGAVQLVEVARAGKLHRAWEFILATVVLVLLSLFNWFGAEPQEDARSYFFRAKARYLKGYFEQSLDDAEQSVALDPSNADAYIQLGNSAYACGAHKQARDAYQRAVQLAPNEPRAYNNLGVAWEALDDPGKAYTAYLLAVGLNPGQETALINAALIELRAGRLDLARKHIRTASREDAQRPDLLCAEAFLARREGRIAEAERLVARASRMAPDLVQQLVQKDLVPLDPAALESAAEDTVPSAVDQSAASSD